MAATKQQSGTEGLIGRRVEELSLTERLEYANKWVAFRIYTPTTEMVVRDGQPAIDLHSRRIEAAGESAQELVAQLRRKNLDPAEFEFTILKQPY
ncbi:MAG: hypothetical protein HYX73_03385 [Acidobacteria bacterium]|nr:hypothetical protein [Acidobacteriota bacterium]